MWRSNPDAHEQQLRRAAAAGDPRAAHALAQILLRSQRLTVQELIAIGAPAADALPPGLRQAVTRRLVPEVWLVTHSWDAPASGPGQLVLPFMDEGSARGEAFRRMGSVLLSDENEDAFGEDELLDIQNTFAFPDQAQDGDPFQTLAWYMDEYRGSLAERDRVELSHRPWGIVP